MGAPGGPRLFLIDGYALIYRSFYALGDQQLKNSRGENTTIAHGAHDFLKRLLEKHKPEFLGWVHDAGYSFRHETFPEYKATREKLEPSMKADFDTGVERISQILDAYRIPILSLDGFEADDVIGTVARHAVADNLNTVIVSGDKDFMQLVRPGVWILNPWHGPPGRKVEKWYDEANAAERLGVPASRVVDYLALLGDSSDNIPGVKGIGEKTAHELIAKFGALEDIIGHLADVTPTRARNALEQGAAKGRLSKQLVTIREDLPVAFDREQLAVKTPDWARLRDLFVELEFRVLAQDAASKAGPDSAAAAGLEQTRPLLERASPSHRYELVDTATGVRELVARARTAGTFALHAGTVLDTGAPPTQSPLRSHMVSLAIAVGPGEAFYLPFAHRARADAHVMDLALDTAGASSAATPVRNLPSLDSAEMEPLRALLADETVKKTAHNAKFEILALRRAEVELQGVDFDCVLASYLLDPGRRSHELDELSVDLLQQPLRPYDELAGKGKSQTPYDQLSTANARDFACARAAALLSLRSLLEPKIATADAGALLKDMELPLVEVLADMEWTGIAIDLPWFHSLKTRFAKERAAAEHAVYQEAGEEFNINSNRQLATILFEKLGLPVRKKTSTGPSTDASVLQELADEGHRLPVLLMEYRELAKLESTYLDTLPALVNPRTGRLHTTFNQAVAATGRLASVDPNLQNIPVRSALGKEIRKGFIPRAGWQLLSADYSQVELRLLAHLSHDPAIVGAFRAGGDIHRQTAAIIFGVDADSVTAEMRGRAKTINFATIYGQGAHALSRQLKIEHAEARAFIDTYFERFAGVRAFLDRMVSEGRERGYVETIFKRRRYIPEIRDRNFNIRAFGERLAQNSPIQGSAADLIKVAMIRIHRRIVREQLASRMLLQVHDELVFELPSEERDALTRLVEQEMTGAVRLEVPLAVDVGTGDNWLQAKE